MEERKKVLELVKSGQLSVDDADQILGAFESRPAEPQVRRRVKVFRQGEPVRAFDVRRTIV